MVSTNEGIVSVGTAKMIGFLLAICGNTLIACSLTLQKSAHNSVLGGSFDGNDDEYNELNEMNTEEEEDGDPASPNGVRESGYIR